MLSNAEEIDTGLNDNNDFLDNSSTHDTLQLDGNSFALRFYEINSQKSNLENIPSQLQTKNNEEHYVLGYNYISKTKLFRYNIFNDNSINIVVINDEDYLVTVYDFPKERLDMTQEQYDNDNFMRSLFIERISNNKKM